MEEVSLLRELEVVEVVVEEERASARARRTDRIARGSARGGQPDSGPSAAAGSKRRLGVSTCRSRAGARVAPGRCASAQRRPIASPAGTASESARTTPMRLTVSRGSTTQERVRRRGRAAGGASGSMASRGGRGSSPGCRDARGASRRPSRRRIHHLHTSDPRRGIRGVPRGDLAGYGRRRPARFIELS